MTQAESNTQHKGHHRSKAVFLFVNRLSLTGRSYRSTEDLVFHLYTTLLAFQLNLLGLLKLRLGHFQILLARAIRELKLPLTRHPESTQKLKVLIFKAKLDPCYAHLVTQGKTE